MLSRDGGFEVIGGDLVALRCLFEEPESLSNPVPIPVISILVFEQDWVATLVDTCIESSGVKHHQGEKGTGGRPSARAMFCQECGQSDGLIT